jgi:cell division ATPase FtsA
MAVGLDIGTTKVVYMMIGKKNEYGKVGILELEI